MYFESSSRREFLARMIVTGSGGPILSIFNLRQAAAQIAFAYESLMMGVLFMAAKIARQAALGQLWLNNSEIITASKNEFDSEIQAFWANDSIIVNRTAGPLHLDTPLQSSDGPLLLGVNFHPWMSIVGYHPSVTLNTHEIASLRAATELFTNAESGWLDQDGTMVIAPFPDTPRLSISQVHVDGFAAIVRKNNLNPNDYRLHYVRYYVMAIRQGGGRVRPQPIIAYAYTRRADADIKEKLNIAYATLQ
jgi:hypothetical protein